MSDIYKHLYDNNLNKIFILGAGFSKAFFKNAPLLIDEYKIDNEKIIKFPYAEKLYKLEKRSDGKINIEKLMTRLSGRMPYDFDREESQMDKELQMNILLGEIEQAYRERLEEVRNGELYEKELKELEAFASYCIDNKVDCITFNHDDYFDEALWRTSFKKEEKCWQPDTGYGFFCNSSESIAKHWSFDTESPSILLFKLHGSINWRVKKGYSCEYKTVQNVVHHESWSLQKAKLERIESHLESEPFFVPPTLEKSDFTDEPILRIVWSQAFKKLNSADIIIFIGCSLPETDSIVEFFFREAITKDCVEIIVVDLKTEGEEKENVRSRYRKIFPLMKNEQFYFEGALEWVIKLYDSASDV